MIGIDYFRAIQNQLGFESENDARINDAKMSLREELMTSVHYVVGARNGVSQGFVVTSSESYFKYEIEALPDEELNVGDMIECFDHMWIVVKTRVASPFQTIGLMWLCNVKFRWQNFSPRIIERWGVLDSGVYSTTRDGDDTVMTPDKQFKIYLPYDDDTKMLFIDKRLAVGTTYNQFGEQILDVYAVTGVDHVSSSYGNDGHLFVLNARSEDFVPVRDNVELLICDYIEKGAEPEEMVGTVSGPETIRLGVSRTYTADFDVDTWSVTPENASIRLSPDGNSAVLTLAMDDDLAGETIRVCAACDDGQAYMDVEVIA